MRRHYAHVAAAVALAIGFATPALAVPSEGAKDGPAFAFDSGMLFASPGPGTGTSPALALYYDFASITDTGLIPGDIVRRSHRDMQTSVLVEKIDHDELSRVLNFQKQAFKRPRARPLKNRA